MPTGSGGTGPSPSHSTSASSGGASGTIMSGASGGLSACATPSGAPLYVFLATEDSRYISGEVIGATGGKPLH